MSAASDYLRNDKARDLALRAREWFIHHPTIDALKADPTVVKIEYEQLPDRYWYHQARADSDFNFGFMIFRPGHPRIYNAAVLDIHVGDKIHWVLCARADEPPSPMQALEYVDQPDLWVHEATHLLDFTEYLHRPKPFVEEDRSNLSRRYYSTPHEFNAFFHQGLCNFRSNTELRTIWLKRLPNNWRSIANHTVFNLGYWDRAFQHSLIPSYRRKFWRRCLNALQHEGLIM